MFGFDPSSVHVRFVVEKVALTNVFLLLCRFSPVHIIPTVLHIVLHPHAVLTNGTNGKDLARCQKAKLFRKSEALDRQDMSLSFFSPLSPSGSQG
jgi:hypothetical protein